ncbi:MAG TPA: tetratricopeptide repeat protein [Daejeonella sp.]|nr:tetratricopeptide repeat protein [Daejeonella sp.]
MRKFILLLLFLGSFGMASAQQKAEEALGMQYFQTGDFEKALLIYQKLFNQSKNESFYDPYFTSLLRLKKYDEAEQLVRGQLKSTPGNYMYQIDLGRVLRERGQQEKATEWYNSLINELPKDEYAIRNLATSFYRAEAYDFAIKTLLKGRKTLNDDQVFAFDLLALYKFRKDKPMLIQEYLSVLGTNPQILPQAQNAFSNLFEDNADYDQLKTSLLRRIQKDPQNLAYTELLTWLYIQQKEFEMALKQTFALDHRLQNDGRQVYELSRVLTANKAYPQAIQALDYLTAKGPENRYYIPAKVDLLNVKTYLLTEGKFSRQQLLDLEQEYQSLLKEFGRNAGTVFASRQLANLQAFYLQKMAEAESELEKVLQLPNLSLVIIAETKLELGDIYILNGEIWEAALIYGQVEKQFANEPAGQEAKFKNARLSYFQGDFNWAKAQLDVLKASTSQLIANDALNLRLLISDNLQHETDTNALKLYAKADMLLFKNQTEKALNTLDSINNLFPSNSLADDILMSKARIFIGQANFQAATGPLQQIIENHAYGLWADDALFMLADLYENKLNQPEKAKTLYQKIITDFPGSLYVIEARKRFRNLRGDNQG